MQVRRITDFDELSSQRLAWNCLTRGVPFRSWEWNQIWWKHFGADRELFVLVVHDSQGQLVGVAPWYAEKSTVRGRCLQFLGNGAACSDYLTVLATPEHEDAVVSSIADWLMAANGSGTENGSQFTEQDRWDLLHLTGVAKADCVIAKMVEGLVEAGNMVFRKDDTNCWRLKLPATWDEYETQLSKSHRKQVRRIDRRLLETGRAVLRVAKSDAELAQGLQILVDLHQKRRRQLDQPGFFADSQLSAFLHELAAAMFRDDRLLLCWVEIDGRPAAIEFQMLGNQVTYAYQAGVDPELLDEEPGRLINIATLKKALADGQQEFDFLRGDEPYKAHWRAEPRPLLELRVVARRGVSQVRAGVWMAGDTMKNFLKSSMTLSGMR